MKWPDTERGRVLQWLDALQLEQHQRGRTEESDVVYGFRKAAAAVLAEPSLLMTTIYSLAAATWRLTVYCQDDGPGR